MASTDKKVPIDSVGELMRKCDEHILTTKQIPTTPGMQWASVMQNTVVAKEESWKAAKLRINKWRTEQPTCADDSKVAKALENLETSLGTGESSPHPKPSAYRSADLSKTVLDEYLVCTRLFIAPEIPIEESKGKIVDAMVELDAVLFSSDL